VGADAPVPLPDPLADLPPTARRIVETARRLLIEKGYPSLSLETIASECGVNKTAVRYYFGNKAGLMEAVVDTWVHENVGLVLQGAKARPTQSPFHTFRVAKQQMSENTEVYLAFLELLPAILRDARHSGRITDLYEWAIDMYGRILEVDLRGLSPQEMRGFTQLIIAVVDGLAVQRAINPERFGTDDAYNMLESVVGAWMDSRRAAGGMSPAEDGDAEAGAG
jgi:AcrR family transcriptional regulator